MSSSLFAASGVLLPGNKAADLRGRCFAWQPEVCTEQNKKADALLIERIRKKSPLDKAAAEILKDAWKKQDGVKALFRFNQVLVLDPQGPHRAEALWGAGAAYAKLGMQEEAVTVLDKAIQTAPNLVDAYVQLAKVHADNRNDIAAAEKVLLTGLEKNPQDTKLTALLEEIRTRKK